MSAFNYVVTVEYLEAYDQGYEAFGTWMDYTDNPYSKGSTEHRGWSDGYCDAEVYTLMLVLNK